MLIGTNYQPNHEAASPVDIASAYMWYVRFPAWTGYNYRPFIDGCRSQGMEPILVLDRASFSTTAWRNHRYQARCRQLAKLYPDLKYVQAGNEPDVQGGESSSSQSVENYHRLAAAARRAWPEAWLLGAGMARIGFEYYNCPHVDIECFHPYGKWVDADEPELDLDTLVGAIRTFTDKSLWATEVGLPISDDTTVEDRARWHSDIFERLHRLGIEGACQFPYSQRMNPAFDGMVDPDDVITPVWPAVEGAARNLELAPGHSESPWSGTQILDACGLASRVLPSIDANWPLILHELHIRGQDGVESQAAAIATTAIETASTFEPVEEAFWLTEAWRYANLRYAPYWGRGFIQLTWDYNYRTYGDELGIDLLGNPRLAMEPYTSARVFASYWTRRNIQEPASQHNWAEVRRLVQGADAGLARLTVICERLLGML